MNKKKARRGAGHGEEADFITSQPIEQCHRLNGLLQPGDGGDEPALCPPAPGGAVKFPYGLATVAGPEAGALAVPLSTDLLVDSRSSHASPTRAAMASSATLRYERGS